MRTQTIVVICKEVRCFPASEITMGSQVSNGGIQIEKPNTQSVYHKCIEEMKQNKLKCVYNNFDNHNDNNNNDATNIIEMHLKLEINHNYMITIDDIHSNDSNDNTVNVNMNYRSKPKPKPKSKSQPIERNVITLNTKNKNVNDLNDNGIEFVYGYWCDGFVFLKYSVDAFNYSQGGFTIIRCNSKLDLSCNQYMHAQPIELTTILFAWKHTCANDFNPPNYEQLSDKRDDKCKCVGYFTCYMIGAPAIPSNAKNINVKYFVNLVYCIISPGIEDIFNILLIIDIISSVCTCGQILKHLSVDLFVIKV